jgi:hypothetical protein
MKAMKLRRIVREAVADAALTPGPYAAHYSVLTIHFAEGGDMKALSIPYQPFENRTDVSIGEYRLVKVGE